jgi:hypothetical protein
MQRQRRPLKDRFDEKWILDIETGCWLWVAATDEHGYGQIGSGGKLKSNGGTGVLIPAHRAAYELYREPIPEGLHLDHLCRHPECVNPWHLEPVTQQENTKRGNVSLSNSQRHKDTTHCKRGHKYTKENTYVQVRKYKSGFVSKMRSCITCRREMAKEYQRNKRNPALE